MFSGFALIAVLRIQRNLKLLSIASVVIGVALLLFMGRSLAVTPISIFAIIYHYRVKRIKAYQFTICLLVGLFFFPMFGVMRAAGEDRKQILEDPIGFVLSSAEHTEDSMKGFMLHYFEFLDTFLRAQQYVDEGRPLLMGKSFTNFLEPLDRNLFGNRLFDSVAIGHFTAVLRDPRMKDAAHGEWATLPAECVLNFGNLGAIPCMMLFGILIGLLGRFPRRGEGSLAVYALYPYAMIMLASAVLLGSNKLFNIVQYGLPFVFVAIIYQRRFYLIKWRFPEYEQLKQWNWLYGSVVGNQQATPFRAGHGQT